MNDPQQLTGSQTALAEAEAQALTDNARNEAQERVAELHREEGSVRSEGAVNSPSPTDIDPASDAIQPAAPTDT